MTQDPRIRHDQKPAPRWYFRLELWVSDNWYVIAAVLFVLFFFVFPFFINEPPTDPYFDRR